MSDAHDPYPFEETDGAIVWHKPASGSGESTPVRLTNWTARIVADRVEDDGEEQRRFFEIEAKANGRTRRFVVPAAHFESLKWVTEQLGAGAVVHDPFAGSRGRVAVAIQRISGFAPEHHVYAHLGWRTHNGEAVYLDNAGGISGAGRVAAIEVEVPAPLHAFNLGSVDDEAAAVRDSLALLDVARDDLIFPLLAAVYRSIIGNCDFTVHLAGCTGSHKSTLAGLVQAHFGRAFDYANLPMSWSSTPNALAELLWYAKDTLVVVDDFAPNGTRQAIDRLHGAAEQLLRGQGNRSGRARLRSDSSFRAARAPRALILSTGEDVPRGQSLRARMLILDLARADIDLSAVTDLQGRAARGQLAAALAGYVAFAARNRSEILERRAEEFARLRTSAQSAADHRRAPAMIADLAFGFELLLEYALEVEAITSEEAETLFARCWGALADAAARQESDQLAADPVHRFLELIRAALASGRVHVVNEHGGKPHSALIERCGWRPDGLSDWRPRGDLIGHVTDDDLFLAPDEALAAAQELARKQGDEIPFGKQTLGSRLFEGGFLVSREEGRGVWTKRRKFCGARPAFWHLRLTDALLIDGPASEGAPVVALGTAVGSLGGNFSAAKLPTRFRLNKPETGAVGSVGSGCRTGEEHRSESAARAS